MAAQVEEKVGEDFDPQLLEKAQSRSWQLLRSLAIQIRPGMNEKDALVLLKTESGRAGVEKMWHPPQIRFGPNTQRAFGEKGEPGVTLREHDLFFLDLGPLFGGYEGDVGETFVVGSDPELHQLKEDSKKIFDLVKTRWRESRLSGEALYAYAQTVAEELGWIFSLKGASGHRVSEFPHSVHYRGKLKTLKHVPSPERWILEIHLRHKTKPYGAFFEDLL